MKNIDNSQKSQLKSVYGVISDYKEELDSYTSKNDWIETKSMFEKLKGSCNKDMEEIF